VYSRWGDEQDWDVVSFARDEHVIEQEFKHRCAFLLGGDDLVQIANNNIHFPFAKVVDGFPVRVPSVGDREGFDAFSCESG